MSGDSDFFEGSEKLLEIWWDTPSKLTAECEEARGDLRCIPRFVLMTENILNL